MIVIFLGLCFFTIVGRWLDWTIETRWIVADTGWNNRTNFQQRPKGGIKEDHSEFRGNERKQRVMAFEGGGGGVVGDEGQLEQRNRFGGS